MSAGDERQAAVEDVVGFLCSRECLGRAPGTPGSEAARRRLVAELEAAGVEPAGEQGYLQPVPGCGFNVLGRLPGRGPLGERSLLVAAHYDHLGAAAGGQAYWGADDNAAAVAILLDLARRYPRGEAGREVIVAFFDGEEPPHFARGTMGSMRYAAHPTRPLAALDGMLCMDLVGHALGPASFPEEVRATLLVLGAELSPGTGALVDACAARARGVRPQRMALDVIPPLSDYLSFQAVGVAPLFLTCGRWEHYHSVTDTPDKLDYPKIVATADFLLDLTRTLATRQDGPVRYQADARDDPASVRTLARLVELLEPHLPAAGALRPMLQRLQRAAPRGFGPSERQLLSLLVAQLEQALG